MQPFWDLMEEARARQDERMEAAERGRLLARQRAGTTHSLQRTSLTLRTAALLRHVADHLEDRSIRTA